MIKYIYVCIRTTCGHVEQTNYAPQASKKCPKCNGTMKRENG